MFVPFITRSSRVERRKGGGGGGKSSGSSSTRTKSTSGSGSSTSSGKKPSGTSSSSSKKKTAVPVTTSKGKSSTSAYGWGGGSTVVITQGQLFAGRRAGGATRNQIYGTRTYGSGYPGVMGRGVAGRGFPFWYWPVVWGYGAPVGSYLRPSEYGDWYNTSRVGGRMAEATFASNSTNTTFHVLSDNSTVSSLISSIDANCSSSLSSSSSTSPQPYNASVPGTPSPSQAIQYYRASSIVLTLDGYNNSATSSSDPNVTDSSLPSGIDMTLLVCLNQTIGLAAPLVNGAGIRWSTVPSSGSLLGLETTLIPRMTRYLSVIHYDHPVERIS
ncbi:hypothetical protein JVT61DRAFT_15088 [Boletus reticuloceps]|uniref:Uncharacterized protein n=1 Tax=Boletus reticuloceps TaxID=495285 RepID=A0A8I3ACH0_9AGAM|nr:hypothetical protein JVT61DRAFT_15088 [Boletus reticuloceps]